MSLQFAGVREQVSLRCHVLPGDRPGVQGLRRGLDVSFAQLCPLEALMTDAWAAARSSMRVRAVSLGWRIERGCGVSAQAELPSKLPVHGREPERRGVERASASEHVLVPFIARICCRLQVVCITGRSPHSFGWGVAFSREIAGICAFRMRPNDGFQLRSEPHKQRLKECCP